MYKLFDQVKVDRKKILNLCLSACLKLKKFFGGKKKYKTLNYFNFFLRNLVIAAVLNLKAC